MMELLDGEKSFKLDLAV